MKATNGAEPVTPIQKWRKNIAVKIIGWVSLPFFALFCVFILDYFNLYQYNRVRSVLEYIVTFPKSYLFEIIFMFVLLGVLLLICRKAVIATGIMGVLTLIVAFVNYMKIALNGDPFFPSDIFMASNTGQLLSFLTLDLPKWFYISVLVIALWVTAYGLSDTEIPVWWAIRLPCAAVIVVVIGILFGSASISRDILEAFEIRSEDTALQSSNYFENGFVGAFTLNLVNMRLEEPEGYSEETIDSILSEYEYTTATGEPYDVVVVLSESFSDIRRLNTLQFTQNPLENYDEILNRDNCYSGSIYTTALGGGTVRPEFEILTGLTTDYLNAGSIPWSYVKNGFESYVSTYKSAGYQTIALHPYDKKFYSRESAYPILGFDEFYGQEDVEQLVPVTYNRGYVSDNSTLDAIIKLMDEATSPVFLSAITMQNHQPYDKIPDADVIVDVKSDALDPEVLDAVVTYTQGVYYADQMLGKLVNYIDSRSRPTILVFYGDHLPTLGTNHAAYNQTGFVDTSDGLDQAERQRMFSTPFLIYSNRDIDIELFASKKGNKISPYNLLNFVSLATGFERTPYMNMLLDFYRTIPAYNSRLGITVTARIDKFLRNMKLITYDRLQGKNYSSFG